MLTYRYKLYSSKRNRKIDAMLREACFVWNHALALQKRYYRLTGMYINLNRMQKQALWLKPVEWVRKQLRKLIGEDAVVAAGNKQAKSGSSVFLSRRQKEIIDKINAKIDKIKKIERDFEEEEDDDEYY